MNRKQILIETIVVTLGAIAGMFLIPKYKTLFAMLPVVYLLIERLLRKRTWADLGFRIKPLWSDLRFNWFLFMLLAFVMQPLTALLAKKFFPAFIFHVQSRLPFDLKTGLLTLIPLLAISLLGEELFYRVLIQGRLSIYLKTAFAILVSSLLFAFAHFSTGPILVVALDLALIFIDSILYGIMYSRRNNIIVVWLAHLIGDVLGLVVILSI